MTREEAKKMLPIIKAYSEGKDIEYVSELCNEWLVPKEPQFEDGIKFRIKPEPKYRPFANAEECWNEMLKHQPFGWVKPKDGNLKNCQSLGSIGDMNHLRNIFEVFTFSDGSVFGVKIYKE